MLYISYKKKKAKKLKFFSYKKSSISKDITRAGKSGEESSAWLRHVFKQCTRSGLESTNAKSKRLYIMPALPTPQKKFIIITKLYKNTTKKCIFI